MTIERMTSRGAPSYIKDDLFAANGGTELVEVAREIGGDSLMVDLTSSQAPLRIASFLKSRHGGVDVVVHNAGLTRDRTLLRMKPERWEQVLEVNLRAVERVDASFDEHELWREGSSQVYLSSIAGIVTSRM